MSVQADNLMRAIYGRNIYDGYGSLLPLDLQGWNSQHQIFVDIITEHRPSVVVDVGVWKGGSSIFLANLLRNIGGQGAVISVDTFLGSPEHWVPGGEHANHIARRNGRPLLYEQFLTNVLLTGTKDLIVPIAQTSINAAAILQRVGVSAGLIHIDAAHEYEATKGDIEAYWPLLSSGGFLVGDDYVDAWPGVIRAVDEFAKTMQQRPVISSPKWIIRKP